MMLTDSEKADLFDAACPTHSGPDTFICRPCADVQDAAIERVISARMAEALREAAKDLPGFDDIRTHGDAANWLRRRANRIASEARHA